MYRSRINKNAKVDRIFLWVIVMRIYSKFSDYYDSIQTFDKDDLLFLRKTDWLCLAEVIHERCYLVEDYRAHPLYPFQFKKMVLLGYRSMILGFCGKIYPFVEIHYKEKNGMTISKTIKVAQFYVQEELDEFLVNMKMKIPERQSHSRMSDLYKNYFSDKERTLAKDKSKLLELFQKLQVPIFLVRKSPQVPDWKEDDYDEAIIETNPYLKELSFQKVFDPYLAFQEISMYLGGVLARPDRPMLTITDEVKAQQHGFDKHSFRAMKGDKKPRKSNRGKKS